MMKSIDLELGHCAAPTTNGNDKPQHVKIVDPVPSNNRRAKWLNEKIMAKRINSNGDHDYERILERNGSLKMKKEKDSGYQEGSLGRNPSFYTKTSCSNDDVTISHGKSNGFSSSERWRPRPSNEDHRKAQLRNTCSLNCNFNHYMEDVFLPMQSTQTFDDADDDDPDLSEGHFGLSRQNGIRHSLKHHLHTHESPTESVCSISSESAESQGDFEPPEDEKRSGSRYGKDKWKRHSIFFNSSESWTEEGLANLTREMTPSSASIFECAVTGDIGRLTELLPENLEDSTRLLKSLNDSAGRTPLHLGADLEVCDKHHKATPLMCAAGCPSLPAVQVLLDNGANVNAGFRETGKTALLWATQAESVDCLKALLQHGALQNPPIAYSETALHIAAALGNLQCVELLVEHGADVTLKKGNSRSTALHLAAEEANIPCIRRLLQAGAPLSAQDAKGQTPLHIAACSDTDVTSLLLAAGAQPHTVDDNGRTPLHCAVARGSRAAECVRLLLEAGAEVNAQDSFGYTPLHLAGVNESSQCASILLHHGADVTAKTKAGTTVLSVLVRKIPDVVRYLVERLDSAVTIHDHDPGDPDCEIRLDFRAIVPNSEKRVPGKAPKQEQIFYHVPRKETEFLTCLLAAGNKKILAHPLSEAFLHLKWKRVRKFFWASLGFQIALVLLYTIYVLNTYLIKCPYDKTLATITDNEEWETAASTVAPPPIFTAFAASDEEKRFNLARTRTRRSSFGFSWFNLDPEKSVSSKTSTVATTTTTQKPALPGGPRTRFIGADVPLPDMPADDARKCLSKFLPDSLSLK